MQKIISARQARINFSTESYIALYNNINNLIVDSSRSQRKIEVDIEGANHQDVIVIRDQLKQLGYDCWINYTTKELCISWEYKLS
jgi:hypothetical protein